MSRTRTSFVFSSFVFLVLRMDNLNNLTHHAFSTNYCIRIPAILLSHAPVDSRNPQKPPNHRTSERNGAQLQSPKQVPISNFQFPITPKKDQATGPPPDPCIAARYRRPDTRCAYRDPPFLSLPGDFHCLLLLSSIFSSF